MDVIASEQGKARSTLDAFPAEEGILDKATELAINGVSSHGIDLTCSGFVPPTRGACPGAPRGA